jgi:OmcA/MtrC family decaheme c-type cytochrome
VKISDLSNKNRSSYHWINFAAVGLLAAALGGCGGGGGGGDTTPAAPATPPVVTPPPAPTVATPTGTAPITLTATTPATTFAALTPAVPEVLVSIASPPKITFSVTDGKGNGIIGLGLGKRQRTTGSTIDALPAYQNLAFALAKLVPGTGTAPSKWVSYMVMGTPTYKSATDKTVVDPVPGRPGSDSFGTLVDNGNGTYTYTFYNDITTVKTRVAAATLTAPNVAADLGDLTYEPNLVHRLTIAISGNAPGTGTNTADGVQVTAGVPMKKPINVIYDFIPATGKAVTATDPSRDIVATAKCNECHSSLGGIPGDTPGSSAALFHGGARNDVRYCVVCHTDQRKYGRSEATVTATGYDSAKGTYLINGITVGNLPTHIHKIHMGEKLTRTGYNYGDLLYNEVTYPQPITNCVKCHDGSATSTAKTANGDNWKNVPSRLACGACHDGVNFAKNTGVTLEDFAAGKTSSSPAHIGGVKTDDSQCAICHTAADIPVYHVTVDPTGANGRGGYPLNTAADTPTVGFPAGQGPSIPLASQLNMPDGVYKINYEIKQVTVSGAAGTKKATVVYRILKDGLPVTLNATGYLIDNVDGSPNIMVAYGVPQDGITTPVDWNGPANAVFGGTSIKSIRDNVGGNSQTGPDASGYYTATLAAIIPDNATMVTAAVGVGYDGFVQLNHASYPKGIRLREPKFVMKVADGYTARRPIVLGDNCNKCHGQLGVDPSFHSGSRNNGEGCAMCHSPNWATGHTGAANGFGGGWSVQIKNLVHGIHGSAKRAQAFTYEATADNPNGFKDVTYPSVLRNCEQCHVAGSYDFSGTANKAALPNLLWTTDARSDMSNPTNAASIGQSPWVTILGKGQVDYSSDNLVSSPIASSCFGCHDSTKAVTHIQGNGGTLVSPASTVSTGARPKFINFLTDSPTASSNTLVFTKKELCMDCHISTSSYGLGIKDVHSK